MLKIFDLVTIRLEQAKLLIRLAMTELVLAVRHAATNVNIIACRCKHNCIRKEPLCIYPCQNNFDRSKCIQSGTALPINIKKYCISSHKYQSYYDSHIRWEISFWFASPFWNGVSSRSIKLEASKKADFHLLLATCKWHFLADNSFAFVIG